MDESNGCILLVPDYSRARQLVRARPLGLPRAHAACCFKLHAYTHRLAAALTVPRENVPQQVLGQHSTPAPYAEAQPGSGPRIDLHQQAAPTPRQRAH